jgi:hypothetical protein
MTNQHLKKIEDNFTINYDQKVIELTEYDYVEFHNIIHNYGLTPQMMLTDIAYDIFNFSPFYIKVNEINGKSRYYNFNTDGQLLRYVAPNGDYYDSYELNPSLITNISELKNTLR